MSRGDQFVPVPNIVSSRWSSFVVFVSGLSAPIPKRIAFFVGLSDNMGPVNEHTDIVFDRVVTNIGYGYEPATGRFTAPINGTYQFNVIVSAQGRQKVASLYTLDGSTS